MKSVAIITDATSSGYLFPVWLNYYGPVVGRENIFLITYRGLASSFDHLRLGYVWELPADYQDELRARVISSTVKALLEIYDVVLRCDVDEFLVPDRRRFPDLKTYLNELDRPYVTALGFDVFEDLSDKPLNIQAPILVTQRSLAVKSSSLNKTCITSLPVRWAEGFHSSTVFPYFYHLYNFHLKFADVENRVAWFEHMAAQAKPSSSEAAYFSNGGEKLRNHQKWLAGLERSDTDELLNITSCDQNFLASVRLSPRNGTYQGEFTINPQVFRLQTDYAGIF